MGTYFCKESDVEEYHSWEYETSVLNKKIMNQDRRIIHIENQLIECNQKLNSIETSLNKLGFCIENALESSMMTNVKFN